MNLDIKKKNCKFYVDKENKKVVCVIPNTRYMARDFINDFNVELYPLSDKLRNEIRMPNSFSGIASCHEDDTFDEEIGKLIAYHKARRKLNISLFKRLNSYIQFVDNELVKMMNVCNNYGHIQSTRENAREEQLKKYLNKE